MTWLAWRQLRLQATVVAAGVGALLVALALSATRLPAAGAAFLQVLGTRDLEVTVFYFGSFAVLCLPAIVGVFWGAPLIARELETGTHRLAWTQSVARTRWLATKLTLTTGAAALATGALSLVVTRWCARLDAAVTAGQTDGSPLGIARIAPPIFEARGLVPVAYAVFAVALGAAVGMLTRRVVPAMAITLAVFVAVQIAMPVFVRPHLAPHSVTTAITPEGLRGLMASIDQTGRPQGPVRDLTVRFDQPGAWEIANETLDRDGRVLGDLPGWFALCVPAGVVKLPEGGVDRGASDACFARAAAEGYRQRVRFQPASGYWTLQAVETAIFLALAGLLAGFSFWWLRTRVR